MINYESQYLDSLSLNTRKLRVILVYHDNYIEQLLGPLVHTANSLTAYNRRGPSIHAAKPRSLIVINSIFEHWRRFYAVTELHD
jgi:hypothetical protein